MDSAREDSKISLPLDAPATPVLHVGTVGRDESDETSPQTLRKVTTRVVGGLSIAVIVAYLALAALQALQNSVNFGGYAMDGAFQLYNPLRRLAAGQIVGEDFPFFHGVGIPLLHYPLFVAFGGNIFASEMARWLLSPVLFVASGLIFMKALLRHWPAALLGTAIFLSLDVVQIRELVTPGNSLLGLRSTVPVFVAALLLFRIGAKRRFWRGVESDWYLLGVYVVLGLSLIMGTEQGVAAILAFGVFRGIQIIRRVGMGIRAILQLAIDFGAVALSVFLWATLASWGHPVKVLTYALFDVPGDQGWMFGTAPNGGFSLEALRLSALGGPTLNLAAAAPRFILTFFIAVALITIAVTSRLLSLSQLSVFGYMTMAGLFVLVGMLGYVNLEDQLAPFGRMSSLMAAGVSALLAFSGVTLGYRSGSTLKRFALHGARLVLIGLIAFTILTGLQMRWKDVRSGPRFELISQAIDAFGKPDKDVVGEAWRANLDSIAGYIPAGATVWSTYSGLPQSTRGTFTPAPGGEDYAIHALGNDRRASYQEGFIQARPDFVLTMEPAYAGAYEEWLWGRYPLLYKTLFTQYRIVMSNGVYILWERADELSNSQIGRERPAARDSSGGFTLPANESDRVEYYWVTVDYHADGGAIPVLSTLPRYYMHETGTATALSYQVLPSNQSTWSFIVPVLAGEGPAVLTPLVVGGLSTAKLDVESVTFSQLSVPSENDALVHLNCEVNNAGLQNESCQ